MTHDDLPSPAENVGSVEFTASRMILDPHTHADAEQETHLKLHQLQCRFPEKALSSGYGNMVLKNTKLQIFRERARQKRLHQKLHADFLSNIEESSCDSAARAEIDRAFQARFPKVWKSFSPGEMEACLHSANLIDKSEGHIIETPKVTTKKQVAKIQDVNKRRRSLSPVKASRERKKDKDSARRKLKNAGLDVFVWLLFAITFIAVLSGEISQTRTTLSLHEHDRASHKLENSQLAAPPAISLHEHDRFKFPINSAAQDQNLPALAIHEHDRKIPHPCSDCTKDSQVNVGSNVQSV